MKRILAASVALVALSSCFLKGSSGVSGNLTAFATRADKLRYEAIYNFNITGQLAGGVSARAEIAQDAPSVLRRLDTTTKSASGNPTTVSSWFVTNASGRYACAQYGGATRCTSDVLDPTMFGYAPIDGFFQLPRQVSAFSSVRKATRPVRIRGEKGTCFEGIPVEPSPPVSSTAQPTLPAQRYRYELCYSDDGILLRGRRTNLALEEAGGAAQDYVLEVVSITRIVQPSDLRLPGPIVSPDQLRP
jgi:hypothetical protein